MTVDHVQPVALGGTDAANNLVAACGDCNAGKSAAAPDAAVVEDVAKDAQRWARAMALAAQTDAAIQAAVEDTVDRFDGIWSHWHSASEGVVPRPADWRASIASMLQAGLDLNDLGGAIAKAMQRRTVVTDQVWRYFCGIAWNTLSDRQAKARRLIERGIV